MNPLVNTISSVVAIVFSISSIVFSLINLIHAKQSQIINGISNNRIHWIESVRSMTMDFIEMYIMGKSTDELETQMYKIMLFMRDDVASYKKMIEAMDNCCKHSDNSDRKDYLDILTHETQEVLAEVWRRTKAEAGMSEKMDKKYAFLSQKY